MQYGIMRHWDQCPSTDPDIYADRLLPIISGAGRKTICVLCWVGADAVLLVPNATKQHQVINTQMVQHPTYLTNLNVEPLTLRYESLFNFHAQSPTLWWFKKRLRSGARGRFAAGWKLIRSQYAINNGCLFCRTLMLLVFGETNQVKSNLHS